ncbi:unnamed protein product, partial [Aphanomyces euteiches]
DAENLSAPTLGDVLFTEAAIVACFQCAVAKPTPRNSVLVMAERENAPWMAVSSAYDRSASVPNMASSETRDCATRLAVANPPK